MASTLNFKITLKLSDTQNLDIMELYNKTKNVKSWEVHEPNLLVSPLYTGSSAYSRLESDLTKWAKHDLPKVEIGIQYQTLEFSIEEWKNLSKRLIKYWFMLDVIAAAEDAYKVYEEVPFLSTEEQKEKFNQIDECATLESLFAILAGFKLQQNRIYFVPDFGICFAQTKPLDAPNLVNWVKLLRYWVADSAKLKTRTSKQKPTGASAIEMMVLPISYRQQVEEPERKEILTWLKQSTHLTPARLKSMARQQVVNTATIEIIPSLEVLDTSVKDKLVEPTQAEQAEEVTQNPEPPQAEQAEEVTQNPEPTQAEETRKPRKSRAKTKKAQ